MAEPAERGLLDTSVVIDLESLPEEVLPAASAISTVTLAELAAGLHTTDDPAKRAVRATRLQTVEATIDAHPFDPDAARRYGQMVALVLAAGRSHRARRLDLMIAATAAANSLPLYTRNATDFAGLESAVTVIDVDSKPADPATQPTHTKGEGG